VDTAAGETTVTHPLEDSLTTTKQDVVKVTALDSANIPLKAFAWTTVTVSTPGIAVTKTLEPSPQNPAPGGKATFRVVVSNTGNVPLVNVDTTDIWPGTCDTMTIPSLGVGKSFSMLCDATTPSAPTASDDFAAVSYSGGSGWVTGSSWTETGDGTSNPNNGTVQVVSGTTLGLPAGYSPTYVVSYTGNKVTVDRPVNLSGRTSAVLPFSYYRSAGFNNGGRNFGVYASGNGTTWTSLGTVTPSAVNVADGGWGTFEATIPVGLLTATTYIRFGDPAIDLTNRTIYFDDVTVLASQVNSVTATGKDPFGQTVTATATAPVQPGLPPLAITKTATTAGPLKVGDTFMYIVTVTNTDTTTQTGLVVEDTLPAGLTLNGTVTADKPAYTRSVTDNFGTSNTESYSTGSGWATAWTETGDDNKADAGKIKIATNIGNPKNSLYFNPDNKLYSIQRTVDLGGLGSASIAFDCSRDTFTSGTGNANDALKLYVGAQLVQTIDSATLASVCPTDKGGSWGTITNTINTAELKNGAVVKFEITGDREIWVDNVAITGTVPAANGIPAGNPPTLTSVGGPYIVPAGQSVKFYIPVKVTAAPTDGYQFSNAATAKTAERTNPVAAAVSTPYNAASFTITKKAVETWVNYPVAGTHNVTYTVELRNDGNADLTPTSVFDPSCNAPLAGPTGDLNTDGKLQVGEIWRYTCTRTVNPTPDSNPDDPDNVPNTATATMTAGGTSITHTADANVKVIHPSIDLTVTPSSATVLTGGTVSYTYTLDNNGDIGITQPAIAAANCTPVTYASGDTDIDGVLDVTETWTFSCTTGALTADQTDQEVTATGNDLIFASPVTDAESVAVTVIDPRMTVVKTASAPGVTAADAIQVGYPNDVTYHYALTNTGNVALSGITALDNKCSPVAAVMIFTAPSYSVSGDSDGDGSFDPDETWQYSCGPVHLEANTTNSVQFDATYSVDGLTGTVSATDTAHVDVMKPKLLLAKKASATRARLDGQITYTYLIENTGATAFLRSGFATPVLSDDKCPSANMTFSRWLVDREPTEVLDPPIPADPNNPDDPGTKGDVIEYTCTTTLTEDMVVDNRVVNTVTTGPATDVLGSTTTPTPAQASVFVIDPDFTVTKVATTSLGGPSDAVEGEAGKPVGYTFTIAHTLPAAGNFMDDLNALALDVVDTKCSAPMIALDADADGFIDGDTDQDGVYDAGDGTPDDPGEMWTPAGDVNRNGVVDPGETWVTEGLYYGDTDANDLLNPGETFMYGCRLAELPDGEPTENTVTVTGTVVERTQTCTTDETPVCTPTEPDDGLNPIERTDTATVSPLSKAVTVVKKALHCDVDVPECDLDLPGSEFMLYTSDPTQPDAGTGVPLTNSPAGSATFVTAKLLLNHDYWLVETRAPDGFQLLAQPIKFHLAKESLTLDESTASGLITVDSSTFTITVVDVPAAELPKAGGEGMWPYLAGGLALLALAGAHLIKTSGPRPARRRVATGPARRDSQPRARHRYNPSFTEE